MCYEPQKIGIIKSLFKAVPPQRVIIFTGSKVKTRDLSIALKRAGFNTRAMHSDLEQSERDEVMFEFRSGKTDVLVATDIVARGIDIDDIQLVINFDVPHDEEDYVHRIGRTARAGRGGQAITLVSEKDQPLFKQIERFLEKEVEKMPVPEELGEAPEYTGKAPGRGKGKGQGKGSGKGRGGKDGQRKGSGKAASPKAQEGRKQGRPKTEKAQQPKDGQAQPKAEKTQPKAEQGQPKDGQTQQPKDEAAGKKKSRHRRGRGGRGRSANKPKEAPGQSPAGPAAEA